MEKDIIKTISTNLIKLRKHKKMTQMELAEKFNFSDKTISKWETGESLPSIEILAKLCEFYGVKLDDLTNENLSFDLKTNGSINKQNNGNKIIISLLAISLVWMVATITYVYAQILEGQSLWMSFIWAIPISFVLCIIFNGIWGKRKYTFVFISLLIWSVIASFYLQFLQFNLWVIFVLGIPAQTSIILWAGLKPKHKQVN